jgi:hypothetical protein
VRKSFFITGQKQSRRTVTELAFVETGHLPSAAGPDAGQASRKIISTIMEMNLRAGKHFDKY